MNNFTFRNANFDDLPFLVDTIIEAEKSGTDILTYATIFGLSEEEVRKYLVDMLAEEVDGCELSISSFLIAEADNQIAGAVAAWIEGMEGVSSTVLKGNLLNFTLPKKALERAFSLNSFVNEIHIEYIPNTIQIGLVYVVKAFRGRNLVNLLIDRQIENLLQKNTEPYCVYVQVFSNNVAAIKAYKRANFNEVLVKESSYNNILDYMPSKSKILMKREL